MYEKIDNTPDLIVNNAGIARFGKLFDQKLSDFQDVVQTNLIGSFIVATEGAKRMVKEDKKGSIINITSVHSVNPGPGVGAYPTTKSGLYSLTKLMALEWGEYGIRVNAIAPGFIDSGMSKPIYKIQYSKFVEKLYHCKDLVQPKILQILFFSSIRRSILHKCKRNSS